MAFHRTWSQAAWSISESLMCRSIAMLLISVCCCLPLLFFLLIFPVVMSFSKLSFLNMWPMKFLCLCWIWFQMILLVFARWGTSSLEMLSVHDIFRSYVGTTFLQLPASSSSSWKWSSIQIHRPWLDVCSIEVLVALCQVITCYLWRYFSCLWNLY